MASYVAHSNQESLPRPFPRSIHKSASGSQLYNVHKYTEEMSSDYRPITRTGSGSLLSNSEIEDEDLIPRSFLKVSTVPFKLDKIYNRKHTYGNNDLSMGEDSEHSPAEKIPSPTQMTVMPTSISELDTDTELALTPEKRTVGGYDKNIFAGNGKTRQKVRFAPKVEMWNGNFEPAEECEDLSLESPHPCVYKYLTEKSGNSNSLFKPKCYEHHLKTASTQPTLYEYVFDRNDTGNSGLGITCPRGKYDSHHYRVEKHSPNSTDQRISPRNTGSHEEKNENSKPLGSVSESSYLGEATHSTQKKEEPWNARSKKCIENYKKLLEEFQSENFLNFSSSKSIPKSSVPIEDNFYAKPVLNSTLKVEKEIRKLADKQMNMLALAREKIKDSPRTRAHFTEKVLNKVNIQGHQFKIDPSLQLASVDCNIEQVVNLAEQVNAEKYEKNIKNASGTARQNSKLKKVASRVPDVMEFFSADFEKETANFSLYSLKPLENKLRTAEKSKAFDLYRHIRCWEELPDATKN